MTTTGFRQWLLHEEGPGDEQGEYKFELQAAISRLYKKMQMWNKKLAIAMQDLSRYEQGQFTTQNIQPIVRAVDQELLTPLQEIIDKGALQHGSALALGNLQDAVNSLRSQAAQIERLDADQVNQSHQATMSRWNPGRQFFAPSTKAGQAWRQFIKSFQKMQQVFYGLADNLGVGNATR